MSQRIQSKCKFCGKIYTEKDFESKQEKPGNRGDVLVVYHFLCDSQHPPHRWVLTTIKGEEE